MIREYGLEPSLLSNWDNFRYFIEKFGVPQGRLISRFPRDWKRRVYDSLAGCRVMERKRIEEGLVNIDKLLFKRHSQWNNEVMWLDNAEQEHARKPFHAIIAKTNPRGLTYVLEADTLTDANPLWKTQRCMIIPRSPEAIAGCARTLIQVSKIVKLVDPYFAPNALRYRQTLDAICSCFSLHDSGANFRFEIHVKDGSQSPQYFQSICLKVLPPLVPNTFQIHVMQWEEIPGGEKLHNRFILTDKGGLSFGVGLDSGEEGHSDEVHLLEEDVSRARFSQYNIPSTVFGLVNSFSIAGTKTVSAQHASI